jgi:putative metalloprotease
MKITPFFQSPSYRRWNRAKMLLFPVLLVGLCSCVEPNSQGGSRVDMTQLLGAAAKGAQSLMVTDAEINQLAKEYMQYMDGQNPLCKTTDANATTKAVATRLAGIVKAIPADLVRSMNLNILAYNVKDVNAFATAGGEVRIFSGLMDVMTPDQILAVIGHEIGHVANKDSKDAFVAALRISALKDAVGSVSGTIGKLTNSQLGELAVAMANAKYSQNQEIKADAYGFDFLKRCGKDTANMASSLGVLLNLQTQAGSSQNTTLQSLFSSHPDLQKRINELNKRK